MPKSNWPIRLTIIGVLAVLGIAIAVWGPSFSSDEEVKNPSSGNVTGIATPEIPENGGQDVATLKDKVEFVIKDSSGREKQRGSTGN